METIFIITFLLIMLTGVLFFAVRLIRWILRSKVRLQVFLAFLVIGVIGGGINHFFFKNMLFIQSSVYPDLYLVEYPEKDPNILHQAIRETLKKHLSSGVASGKKLAYERENSILFYKYYKAFAFNVFQDAGTAYFLDNEEDLGGFVTEELGMYSQYRLAEFNYAPCKADETLLCGEISYFNEGQRVKSESLLNLATSDKTTKEASMDLAHPNSEGLSDTDISKDHLQMAFLAKDEELFLNQFPDSFQQFINYFGGELQSSYPNKLRNENDAYIDYFFQLISHERYRKFETKLIDIAKDGKWTTDTVNYFRDKMREYIKKDQRYNLINNLKLKEAESVLFFLFDGPDSQFDEEFSQGLDDHRMQFVHDLFSDNVETLKE